MVLQRIIHLVAIDENIRKFENIIIYNIRFAVLLQFI